MFSLSLQKGRNIPTLYEQVHDFLGHPEGCLCVCVCVCECVCVRACV